MSKKRFNVDGFGFDSMPGQSDNIVNLVSSAKDSLGLVENIMKLDCSKIDNWIYRDRTEHELGDIEALANSIIVKDQAQPIVVAKTSEIFIPKNNKDAKYVIIAGYRRWLACQKANIEIKAIIKDCSFIEAVKTLDAENEKESVSEYSKGTFYSKLINDKKVSFAKLKEELGISAGGLSNLLSYSELPKNLIKEIYDMSNVSPRTAAYIKKTINDNSNALCIFIENAKSIRNGAGEKRLEKILNDRKTKDDDIFTPIVVMSKNSIKIDLNKITEEQLKLIKDFLQEVIPNG